jgi:hypothetical protein
MKNISEKLYDALGADGMRALVDAFGGKRIYVPKQVHVPDRDDKIIVLFSESIESGASCMSSYERCADETGLTVRRIQQIVAAI